MLIENILECINELGNNQFESIDFYSETWKQQVQDELQMCIDFDSPQWQEKIMQKVFVQEHLYWLNIIIATYKAEQERLIAFKERIKSNLEEYTKQWTEMEVKINNEDDSSIAIRPPYFMRGSQKSRTKGERDKVEKALESTKKHIEQGEGDFQKLRGETVGKAHPEVIRIYLNKYYEGKKSVSGIEQHLKNYAIGIDCSGFVSRAIAHVMTQLGISKEIQFETLGKDGEYLKTNATTLNPVNKADSIKEGRIIFSGKSGSIPLFLIKKEKKTYNIVNKKKVIKIKETNPYLYVLTRLRPGDIVIKKPEKQVIHIYIVVSVGKNYIVLSDSTSTGDKTGVQEKTYNYNDGVEFPFSSEYNWVIARPKAFNAYYDNKY